MPRSGLFTFVKWRKFCKQIHAIEMLSNEDEMGLFLRTIIVISAPLLALTACESRFNDKAPATLPKSEGFSAESRLKANDELDAKLAKLESSADKIRKLIRQFRRVQAAKIGEDTYTQLDFMLDVNQELRKSPIENKGGKWIKYGKMKLNIKGLSPECALVESKVETTSSILNPPDASEESLPEVRDAMVLSIKTCKSPEFTDIAKFEFTGKKTVLNFNNVNLRKALEETVIPAVTETTSCDIQTDNTDVLGRVSCANLSTKLSATENLLIDTLTYDRFDAIRFLFQGRFMAGEQQKGTIHFAINREGKPELKIETTH